MLQSYASLTWTNVNEIDYLNQDLLPQWRTATLAIENVVLKYHLRYWWFVMAVAGLGLSLLTGRRRQAAILGICYIYYVLLCGIFPWQGSRLFYQSEIASSILTAIVLAASFHKISTSVSRFRYPKQKPPHC
jgi:cytochrome oxidase assembly protein ShyY1